MRKIFFATTNKGKLEEAQSLLNCEVEGSGLEIDEIQSLDSTEVALKKARSYYKELKKPILVEDVSLVFNALGQLPGTYINDFSKALGNEGLINLLKGKKDRSATAFTTLVFIDNKGKEHTFIGSTKGTISRSQKGEGFGWDPIFIPKGIKETFGQLKLEGKNKYSMRAKAFRKFRSWLDNN